MTPRGWRGSGTWSGVLIDPRVDIRTEAIRVQGGSTGERGERNVGSHELSSPGGHKLANGHAVARDHEGLASVERPHDLATGVSKLALCDGAAHPSSVAQVLHRLASYRTRGIAS